MKVNLRLKLRLGVKLSCHKMTDYREDFLRKLFMSIHCRISFSGK